ITNEAGGIAKLVELDFCRGCDVVITPRTTKGVKCARAGAVTRCKLPNMKPRKHLRLPVFVSSKKGAKGAKIASDLYVRTGDTRGDHCHHFTGRAQLGGCNRRDNTGGLAVELPFARTFKTTVYPYGVPSAAELVKSGSSWPVHCARACSATLTLEVSRATQRKLKLPSRQIAIGSTRIKKAGLVNPRARLDRRSRAVFRKLGKRSAKVTVRVTVQERRKAAKRFKATGTIRR
ncbi:MAG: hypothetical protein GX557_04745, partial [Chloroflexi bacterium]|nr:hypothetical protein [Chloroflexota bacterium]